MARTPSEASKPDETAAAKRPPVLQWIAAGCGFLLTLGAAGVIVAEALQPIRPADLAVRIESQRRTSTHLIVDVVVSNTGTETAAAVDIAGEIDGQTASATLDYVPGGGEAKGAVVFPASAAGTPDVRVAGWSEP